MLNDDCTVAHIMLVPFDIPFTMIIQGISDRLIAGHLRLYSWRICKVYRFCQLGFSRVEGPKSKGVSVSPSRAWETSAR